MPFMYFALLKVFISKLMVINKQILTVIRINIDLVCKNNDLVGSVNSQYSICLISK